MFRYTDLEKKIIRHIYGILLQIIMQGLIISLKELLDWLIVGIRSTRSGQSQSSN